MVREMLKDYWPHLRTQSEPRDIIFEVDQEDGNGRFIRAIIPDECWTLVQEHHSMIFVRLGASAGKRPNPANNNSGGIKNTTQPPAHHRNVRLGKGSYKKRGEGEKTDAMKQVRRKYRQTNLVEDEGTREYKQSIHSIRRQESIRRTERRNPRRHCQYSPTCIAHIF